MIAFRDFVPQSQRKRYLGMIKEYENLQEVVSRVNRWIEQDSIDVLNVETVLVPNLGSEEAEPKTKMDSAGTTLSSYQIVRVWFRQSSANNIFTGETTRLSLGEHE